MKREPTSVSHQELLSTYRFVRLAMPGLAFLLAVGVTIQIFSPADNCWLGSISAYYYTPARAVFVACLCSIGTCLFVYRGTTEREDLVLNISGILAFFVALIPTPLDEAETGPKSLCGRSNVPTDTQLSDALANNIWSALAALVMVAIAYAVFGGFIKQGHGRPSTKAVVTSLVVAAVPVVLYVGWPDKVESWGHYVAAVGLFIGVILMTLMHTWPGTFAGKRADGSRPTTEPKLPEDLRSRDRADGGRPGRGPGDEVRAGPRQRIVRARVRTDRGVRDLLVGADLGELGTWRTRHRRTPRRRTRRRRRQPTSRRCPATARRCGGRSPDAG